MVLKQEVVDAFALLGVDPDADLATATAAYKRQALLHHPDRNHGDPGATQRFQQVGAAWDICQRHFDNPAWSQSSSFDDDDIPLDEDDLYEFYMFMFAETLFGRYSRARGQRYRYEHSRTAGGHFTIFIDPDDSQERHARNIERQRKESEEYEKRLKELENEIEEEKREREKEAKLRQAENARRANALDLTFQAAYAGDSSTAKKYILDYDLDVNTPRKRPKQGSSEFVQFDSLLHVAASRCDETFVMFLTERGAKHTVLNKSQLTPFHAAIKAGNTKVVKFIMEHGRSFEGYHPSKAAPSGSTPLQLAVESGVPSVVELLVRHATTHDVEKCWKQDNVSEEIREVLQTKKGFVPGEIGSAGSPSASKKAQRQQELAQQKESRIAEELERARINRQKREERAARRAEQEARLRAELQERIQSETENNSTAQAGEKDANASILSAEQRPRCSKDRMQDDLQQDQDKHDDAAQQESVIFDETNSHAEIPSVKAEVSYEQPCEKPLTKTSENAQVHRPAERVEAEPESEVPHEEPASRQSPPKGVKKTKVVKQSAKSVEEMDERERQKYEATMRRRAEQSARDKERHRRMVEERARAKAEAQASKPPKAASPPKAGSSVQYAMPIEDIQTCIVPDDLFRDDPPPRPPPVEEAAATRGRRGYRGRYRYRRGVDRGAVDR